MKKDPLIYIEHISTCISRIKEYTGDIDEDGFLKNNLIQDAVIRNFEIIGEAVKSLPEELRQQTPFVKPLSDIQREIRSANAN